MSALEDIIGYKFKDSSLLKTALTHPSLNKGQNNQRLEFLGDAVLGLVIAKMLYELFPSEQEGELARRHAALVRGETLTQIARGLSLGDHLAMTESESNAGGRNNATNLEDAIEALLGAIFIDGGMQPSEIFIHKHWAELARNISSPPKDAKTALQEWAQGRGLPVPTYIIKETIGPAHAPEFTIEVRIEGYPPMHAKAASKRMAEQLAAQHLLETLPHA